MDYRVCKECYYATLTENRHTICKKSENQITHRIPYCPMGYTLDDIDEMDRLDGFDVNSILKIGIKITSN